MLAEPIGRSLDAIVAWLLTYAVHSTVLIAAAWIAAVCLARAACNSARLRDALPSIRERLWKLALCGGLVTAGAQAMFGFDPWGLQLALRTNIATEVAHAESSTTREPISPAVDLPMASTRTTANPGPPPTLSSATSSSPTSSTSGDPTPGNRTSKNPVETTPAATTAAASSAPSETTGGSASLSPALVRTAELPPAALPALLPSVAVPAADPIAGPAHMPGWIQVAVIVWLAGVLFGLARWACQWNRLLRNLDDREPIVSGHVYEIFQHLRLRSKSRANVTLHAAPAIGAPITLGLRRFSICLPPRVATELQRDEIAALLAHELAHAERRDPAWVVACRAIEIVFFFQPLNKLCAGWLADEAEYLCDDRAVVQIGERVPLASCLTEIAGWIVHSTPSRLAPGMAAPGTRLSLRVGRLLDEDHDPNAPDTSRWFTAAVVPAALCVAVFVPGVAAQAPIVEHEDEIAREVEECDEEELDDADESCCDDDLSDRTRELELALEEPPMDPPAPPEPLASAVAQPTPTPVPEPQKRMLVRVTTTEQFLLQPAPPAKIACVPAAPAPASAVSGSAVPEPAGALDAIDALADELERMRADLETRVADASFKRRLDHLASRLGAMREHAGLLQAALDVAVDAAPVADEPGEPAPSRSPYTWVPSFPFQAKD